MVEVKEGDHKLCTTGTAEPQHSQRNTHEAEAKVEVQVEEEVEVEVE